nr:hypothetical protein [Methylobacterium sp. ZNC0032]
MSYMTVTVTILDPRGDPMDVTLGANHVQLSKMYLDCSAARANPGLWAAQERAATRIGVALAARRCLTPHAEFTLAQLMRMFPTNSLAEIAMAERMDFLRLRPGLKKFRINKPFWAGHAYDAARDILARPEAADFWARHWGADLADIRLVTALMFTRARTIISDGGLH